MSTTLTWHDVIGQEKEKPYFVETLKFVAAERAAGKTIYPPQQDVFNAFRSEELADVKVVILGQDPYHGEGQAHGLAFSVQQGVRIPPSLQNIYKELESDLGVKSPESGNLEKWANEGVLLMNTSWSVERGKPGSHADFGWMEFSESLLDFLNDFERPLVFILWGAHAQKVGEKITNPKHFKIKSAHPSPFSARRGFFGSKPFSRANEFLVDNNQDPIDWLI